MQGNTGAMSPALSVSVPSIPCTVTAVITALQETNCSLLSLLLCLSTSLKRFGCVSRSVILFYLSVCHFVVLFLLCFLCFVFFLHLKKNIS